MQNLERIVLFLFLLLATGAGQAFWEASSSTTESGSQPITQAVYGLLYLFFFLVLLRKFRKTALFLVRKEIWTAVLCFWVLASTMWSVDSGETVRRAIALAGTSMAGLYLGMRYEPKQQLKMIALVIGIGALASLAVGILLPGTGLTSDGSWQGVYFPKNSLGRMMALGAMCFGLLALGQRRHRGVRLTMFILCGVLLLLSKSATAVVVVMLMLVLLPFRRLLFLRTKRLIAVTVVLAPVVAGAVFGIVEYSDQILLALGRSSSLTGRIPLWEMVWKEIGSRPWQGFGFTAFWHSWEGERVSDAAAWDVAVPHAHNGFLEVWLGLGLIGLLIVIIGMLRSLRLSLRVAKDHREIDRSWPLVLILFTVLYNLTETSLLAVNSILWMTYVANSFWLVRMTQEEKPEVEAQLEREFAYSV